ncbi:YihY family inner membrane protein [uncultured Helicobacter sp.]|uniref:YihY family inner membrane protein n=1 Tax=uncultured Helicobacter sp. TaxID=175537 RepID=UPI0026339C1F|nr:YihY family inner membrane protein [uncultured Helicobacter sp.]
MKSFKSRMASWREVRDWREFISKLCKSFMLAYRFLTYRQEMFYYASSLSFYTIFALIPMLFITFSVLLAFSSFQDKVIDVERLILSNILPTNAEVVMNFMNTFLANGNKMGMVGVISVFITSLLFFRNYEFITSKMFNSKPRKFFDSLMMYWTMITLFPLASVAMFYFSLYAQDILNAHSKSLLWSHIFSWCATCVLFLVLFRISANKPLHKKTLLISSCVSGSIWFMMKNLFVYYVTLNTTYSTLYGSVSIVLFLMVWIYVSWLVMLFGMRACQGILQCFRLEKPTKDDML